MAQITAKLIKELRDETGAGMMDVKKALTEAEGDIARAKEIIRARGIAAAGKREGREAQEGLVASQVADVADGQIGYAIELNSETDFVAKTPQFVEFGDEVIADIVKAGATTVAEVEAAPSKSGTVKETVEEAGALFHEHVKIGQFATISGPHVEIYAHRKSAELPPSIAALIATDENGAKVAHEVALQICAHINLNNQQQLILSSNTNPFTGTFIGDEHTLSNIRLIGHNYLGLFGRNTGTIKDLKLDNIYVKGFDKTGALIGQNEGSGVVKGIWLTGDTLGNTEVGGLVGYNYGTITSAKVTGNVTTTGPESGLIVGCNYGYGTGNVGQIEAVGKGNVISSYNGTPYVGGIVGYNSGGTINTAYQGGAITSSSNSYTNRILGGYNSNYWLTLNVISSETATINGNTIISTSLSDLNGKSYSDSALLTSTPYEEIGLNFSVTDPTIKEYIWYFTTGNDPELLFTRN